MTMLQPLSSLLLYMKNGTTADQNQDGRGLPATRIETISDGSIDPKRVRFVELDAAGVERWKLSQGDILLSHINSVEHIGKSAIYQGVPETLIHGMNLMLLRPDQSQVLPEYLHFGLRSRGIREHIRARCKRAINQASINQKELGAIELPVPPLPEQRRIVDLLSRAEGIVRLRREAEKKAAELIPALFLDMFSDIDQSSYQKAEQLCRFITKGTTPKASEITTLNDGNRIPFLKVLHIEDNGQIDFERKPAFVSKEQHCSLLARSVVRPQDVLMNIVGPPLGRICLVPSSFPEWNINQALAIFRPKPGVIPTFLFHALRSPLVLPKILQLPVGVRQLNISLEQCRNLEIPVPPETAQQQFVSRADEIAAIQSQQSTATAKAQATFDALLAQAFTA